MNRIELIQAIIDKGDFKGYLEIGTENGKSFLPIKCPTKLAVDPRFRISPFSKLRWLLKNPCNFSSRYFQVRSDDFFAQQQRVLEQAAPLGVVFVDGLHTFEAALRDTLSASSHLAENGVIIMHDCLPPHEAAALPTASFPDGEERKVEGWNGEWCGDVWKAVLYLRRKYPESLEVFVIDTDYGLGVVRYKNGKADLGEIDESLFDTIDAMTFAEMIDNAKELLDIRPVDCAHELVSSI